jgi:hypothetical protein
MLLFVGWFVSRLYVFLGIDIFVIHLEGDGFVWEWLFFVAGHDFGFNVLFLLFFSEFLIVGLATFADEWFSRLSFFRVDLIGEVDIFGNGGWVIVNVHAVNVFFHFKGFLMHVVWSFGLFASFGTQTRADVPH